MWLHASHALPPPSPSLSPDAEASSRALSKGGIFAFTVERLDDVTESRRRAAESPVSEAEVSEADYDKGWKLRFTGRFAHSRPYITALAAEHGFGVVVHEDIVPRRDNGVDIQGHLLVLERLPSP